MNLSKRLSSIILRFKYYKLGIFFLRFKDLQLPPKKILLKYRYKKLALPSFNEKFSWEFKSIFINDCYSLRKLEKSPKLILDVGANIGYFSILSRILFSKARIVSYEPNLNLQHYLNLNSSLFNFEYYPFAVGSKESKANLIFTDSELTTQTQISENGKIIVKSIDNIIEDLGVIDLVKLDCEGAEWDIFKSENFFRNTKIITMEYHLWATQNYNIEKLKYLFRQKQFEIIELNPLSDSWGMLLAFNQNFS